MRTCQYPGCGATAVSRVGPKHEGEWNGHTLLTCQPHRGWALNHPTFGPVIYVGSV